jgi:mannose-6-phosphate isomerase-like protein (cupin superfamily)
MVKIVSKNWGYEKWLVNNEKYCGKILHFFKGKKCSWHRHLIKEEHFYIHSGELEVKWGWSDDIDEAHTDYLYAGDVFHVPVGMRHQMRGIMETEMFEFSTHHEDSDSIILIKGD